MSNDARNSIIDTWHDLLETIGDYERGRLTMGDCRRAHGDYRKACEAFGEPHFMLSEIMATGDWVDIPTGYPVIKCQLPYSKDVGGAYDTAHARRIVEQTRGKKP